MRETRVSSRRGWRLAAACALFLLIAATASAQNQTGNIFGVVVDNSGDPIPGVTVTLTGIAAPQTFVTSDSGDFRFPSLSPGRYLVTAELSGFGRTEQRVEVNVGRSSEARILLAPAIEQTITVTAETPLLDVRQTGTGATLTQVELEQIPTARDPWVVLQQAPGVLMDRINVGGNESGQQSSYVGKGVEGAQATWNVDGVNITDMAATGSTPTYYDFDAFEEMQVTTGGSDPRIQTAGVQMNMVTKRGTNELTGSGRYFTTDNSYQANAKIPAEATDYLLFVNEIDDIVDMGVEVGGPLIRDRLWGWAAWGDQQIDLLVASGTSHSADKTTLENLNGKLNAQLVESNSATFLYTNGDKIKIGRNASAARPVELGSAWNQSGPTDLYKLEDTHVFSPNFYATLLASKVDGGFGLLPGGGLETEAWLSPENVYHNTYSFYRTDRPQESYRLDLASFMDAAGATHELKYGFGYRDTPVTSQSGWPGRNVYGYTFGDAPGEGLAYLFRYGQANYGTEYLDLYLGDTIQFGNWTIQAALRYDQQEGSNSAATVPENPIIPDILPAVSFAGDPAPLEWTSIAPRVGLTYTFGESHRTLVRAAYNVYVDQLGAGPVSAANPIGYYQYVSYYWDDANADRNVDRSEILFDQGIYSAYNVDPANPAVFDVFTRYDPDMDPPNTNEILLGIEHELIPQLVIGANFTHRTLDDFSTTRYEKTRGAGDWYSAADYEIKDNVNGTLPSGDGYSVPVYGLKDGIEAPLWGVITNRPDYDQTYEGVELNLTKRLSNRWMARAALSFHDWTQDVGPDGSPTGDPTERLATYGCTVCDGIVVQGSGTGSGAKGGIYINSGWGLNLTGLYELSWGISVGAAVTGREGYPIPYNHRANVADGRGTQVVLVDGVDGSRHDDIFTADLRLAKEFVWRDVGFTLSADVFNATDERTIMQRNIGLFNTFTTPNPAANRITEILSPRVFRFGARLNF